VSEADESPAPTLASEPEPGLEPELKFEAVEPVEIAEANAEAGAEAGNGSEEEFVVRPRRNKK
jgi:hypothetical protein